MPRLKRGLTFQSSAYKFVNRLIWQLGLDWEPVEGGIFLAEPTIEPSDYPEFQPVSGSVEPPDQAEETSLTGEGDVAIAQTVL